MSHTIPNDARSRRAAAALNENRKLEINLIHDMMADNRATINEDGANRFQGRPFPAYLAGFALWVRAGGTEWARSAG